MPTMEKMLMSCYILQVSEEVTRNPQSTPGTEQVLNREELTVQLISVRCTFSLRFHLLLTHRKIKPLTKTPFLLIFQKSI